MPPGVAFDVTVVGGGPAGSACARHLLRAGLRVRIVSTPVRARPAADILTPATLRGLRSAGFRLDDIRTEGTRCTKVGAVWSGKTADYFDYELYACEAALAVDRQTFDAALLEQTAAAGADVLTGRIKVASRANDLWSFRVESSAQETDWQTPYLIDATGRHGLGGAQFRRLYVDQLVAFSTPFVAPHATSHLLLDAVEHGWWYLSPRHYGGHVVFLTDADLVPRERNARSVWIAQQFNQTQLVREAMAHIPDFLAHRGCDARTSRVDSFVAAGRIAIGDAAFTNDPLSGRGIQLALEQAHVAANCVVCELNGTRGRSLEALEAWYEDDFTQAQRVRVRVYEEASCQLRRAPFWARRIRS